MSSTGAQNPLTRVSSGPRDLRLVNWPLRDEIPGAWLVAAAAAAAAVVAGAVADSVPVGLLSFGVLAASLWRLWLPVGLELGPRGVTQTVWRRRRRIAWPQIRRYEVRARGVLLLSDEAEFSLAALGGLYIPFGGRRDELLAVIDFYVGAPRTKEATPSKRHG